MLYQNLIRNFFRPIGYPIVPPSKLYEDNQAKIKRVLEEMINPQVRPLGILITAIHKIHICKKFYMVDTISNMQLADLK